MTLRYLQTLIEIGVEQNTTIIFPLPLDLLGGLSAAEGRSERCRRGAGLAGTERDESMH